MKKNKKVVYSDSHRGLLEEIHDVAITGATILGKAQGKKIQTDAKLHLKASVSVENGETKLPQSFSQVTRLPLHLQLVNKYIAGIRNSYLETS